MSNLEKFHPSTSVNWKDFWKKTRFDLLPEIVDLVKDKRMAFVAGSPTLIDSGSGEHIDSYDLVCRINKWFCIPEDQQKDYGKRCDLLFHDTFVRFGEKDHFNTGGKDFILNNDFPIITARWNNKTKATFRVGLTEGGFDWDKRFFRMTRHFREYMDDFLTRNFLTPQERKKGIVGHPGSGTCAIAMLLAHGVDELFLTGFSYYTTDKHYINADNSPVITHHDINSQIRFLKYLRDNSDGRLTCDDYLSSVFNQI